MSMTTCKYCGVWDDEHDYEHMARECYPAQIDKLEERIAKLERENEALEEENESLRQQIRDITPDLYI